MSRYVSLIVLIVLVVGCGSLIGINNVPGAWYEALNKPPFNPPNWIFGPVWTVLYIMIAIAGWRTWQRAPRSAAMAVWVLQIGLNYLWSPFFFGMQMPGAALVVVLAMLASIAVFIALTWRSDRASALLFLPYLAWVAFASLLNASIVFLN